MTDAAFLLSVLEDGQPHSTNSILAQSLSERGCGLMVHSRAADLRKRGHYIICDYAGKQNGRPVYEYRLLGSLSEEEPSVSHRGTEMASKAAPDLAGPGDPASSSLSVPEQLRLSEVA